MLAVFRRVFRAVCRPFCWRCEVLCELRLVVLDGRQIVFLVVRQIVFPRAVVFLVLVGFRGGFVLFLGCSIFGSCACCFSRPLLPAVLQFDFCNISQIGLFLGVVGLYAGRGPHVACRAVLWLLVAGCSADCRPASCPACSADCVPPRCASSGCVVGSAGGVSATLLCCFL